MTPLQIQRQIAYLSRCLTDILFRYEIAYLANDKAEIRLLQDMAHDLRVDILRCKIGL